MSAAGPPVTLRLAVPADVLAVARVHVATWQTAYRGLVPDAYLDRLQAEERATRYDFSHVDASKPRTIVGVADGSVVGFATTAPAAAGTPGGELCALHVHPGWWGRGIGVTLIEEARAHLIATGHRTAWLWMLDGNARAERFYRQDRWEPDGARRTVDVWGVTLREVRFAREL
ncbi:MAG: GNAT family N-acetyltransferase [Vicinamibacterales bacterium]